MIGSYGLRRTTLSPVAEPRDKFLKGLKDCPQGERCGLVFTSMPMAAATITAETTDIMVHELVDEMTDEVVDETIEAVDAKGDATGKMVPTGRKVMTGKSIPTGRKIPSGKEVPSGRMAETGKMRVAQGDVIAVDLFACAKCGVFALDFEGPAA